MTSPDGSAADPVPLHESLPYYVPLLLTRDQHLWLYERFPVAVWGQVPFALTRAEIRQCAWETFQLHTPLTPFPLAAELSGLPRLAWGALSCLESGETLPGEIEPGAEQQAWLEPRSVRLVPPVTTAAPYRVTFAFFSTHPLYHTLHSCYDAIIRETEQTVRAALLEVRVQQLQDQLAQAGSAREPLPPAEDDHRGDESQG